jgi:putative DNA primase/helicase
MLWEENAYRKIEVEEIKKRILLFLEMARVINKDGGYEEFPATPARINEIETLLRNKRFTQLGKDTPCWIGNSAEKPASVTDASLLIFDKTKILHIADPESCQTKMEILPPSPHWFNLAALDYEFDPNADCPQWKQFLNDILGDDKESKDTIMEFMGLCLTTITKFQKALYIKGPIRSGKGTIARIMQAVIGKHNVAAQSMEDFAEKFGLETFIGKTLAAVSDARVKNISPGTVEKLLKITGEDSVRLNKKNKTDLPEIRLKTKLLFLSNMLIKIPDPSGALPSRFIYVKLTKSFYDNEDKDLEKKLLAELPGILNSAIRHLRTLLTRKFIQPKTGEVLYKQMMGLCSPVYVFAQELEPYMHPDIIWKRWCEFCKDEEEKPGTQKDLWKELEAAGYNCDLDAARILAKIRKLGREAIPTELRDCAEKFKNSPEVLDKKLQEMVERGLLDVRNGTAGNRKPTKFYSIPAKT